MQTTLLSRIFLPFGLGVLAFGQPTVPPVKPPVAAAKPAAVAPPVVKREPGLYCDMTIVQGTVPMGTITLMLLEKESPITVKNFSDLAMGRKEYTNPMTRLKSRLPFFNGLIFHRVIPGFMIQGGDPTGSGMGGTEAIPDEFHPSLKFDVPGRLAMANSGQPGSGSCQFFITDGTPSHLNGKHTIFGQVVTGQELVAKIARVPTGAAGQDKPNVPVKMARVRVYREPQAPAPVQKKAVPAAPKPAAAKPAVVAPKPAAVPAPKPMVPKPVAPAK